MNTDYFHVVPEAATNSGQVLLTHQRTMMDVLDGINQVGQTVSQWMGMSSAQAEQVRQMAQGIINDYAVLTGNSGNQVIGGVQDIVAADNAAARRLAV